MGEHLIGECPASGWFHEWSAPYGGTVACNYCGVIRRVPTPDEAALRDASVARAAERRAEAQAADEARRVHAERVAAAEEAVLEAVEAERAAEEAPGVRLGPDYLARVEASWRVLADAKKARRAAVDAWLALRGEVSDAG